MEIVAADIGGTNARFALARIGQGKVLALDEPITFRTAEHGSLKMAWEALASRVGRSLPRAAAIAVASPVTGDVLKLTNSPWIIRPAALAADLGLDTHVLINDFGAVAHAVAHCGQEQLTPVCGPDAPLPAEGAISIVGPGTGLGVAQLIRHAGGYIVNETEGGHVDFAPLDAIEDRILARLRERHRRVSVERIVAGPGLAAIEEALAEIAGRPVPQRDDKARWQAALDGADSLAAAALDRFCLSLGAVAGDIALAQGAKAVVIAGGLGLRLAGHLPRSGFADRFVAKGRFEAMMAAIPVRMIVHPQPGLFGAAAALAVSFQRSGKEPPTPPVGGMGAMGGPVSDRA